jgi:uncharacterized protein YdeI (YjbR/CyaY-like superfamily)
MIDDLPETGDGLARIYAPDRAVWRAWLETNGETAPAVWLVYYKKGSGQPSITWDEAVDEALCFGWIDSKARPIDERRYMQYFSPRKPKSAWSAVNKARLERLTAAGLMREPGLRAIAAAKANGSWSALDDVDALVVPDDLAAAFESSPAARDTFDRLSRSARWAILHRLATAKRPDTRARRIAAAIAALAPPDSPDTIGSGMAGLRRLTTHD